MFESINKTLGHEPDDPKFIVTLEAQVEQHFFSKDTLELVRTETSTTEAHWNEAWSDDSVRSPAKSSVDALE